MESFVLDLILPDSSETHMTDSLLRILFLGLLLILVCLFSCLSGYFSLLWPLSMVLPSGSALETRLLLFSPSRLSPIHSCSFNPKEVDPGQS